MNQVYIGCPVKNDLESFGLMINSLENSTVSYDKILIVDGGSNEENLRYYRKIELINPKVQIVLANTKTPLEAYNILFEEAKKDKADLLLTQTDVAFPRCYKRDWLAQMRAIAQDENTGAITTLNGGGISGESYLNNFEWLGGWCTYIPYRTIEKLGGYDSNFPNGFGVDIDYTYAIIKAGLKIYKIDYWVDHHMQNTREHDTNANAEQMKQEAAKFFRQKWKLGEFKNVLD